MNSEDLLMALTLMATTAAVTLGLSSFSRTIRRFKVRPMNRQRDRISVYERIVKFAARNDREQFFKYTRMSPEMFDHLLGLLNIHLQRTSFKNPIKPGQRLAMTLHYLAEGCSMQEIAWNNYIGKSTAHYIITETCRILWDVLSPIVLPVPTTEQLKKIAEENFKRWNMPNCIGAIDGKHVIIQKPKFSGSTYYSYKKSCSLILMAACDSYYKFTYVDIGAAGANHDSSVFKQSSYGAALLNGTLNIPPPRKLPGTNQSFPHFFVADQAFPLHINIMRPYAGSYLGEAKNIFNYRLSRVRRTIENSFGILAQRWRRLRNPIIANIENCESIVKACIVLHNYIQRGEEDLHINDRRYCPTGFVDWTDADGNMRDGLWRSMGENLRSVGRLGSNNSSRVVKQLRETLLEYLISPAGALMHQWDRVHEGGVPDDFLSDK